MNGVCYEYFPHDIYKKMAMYWLFLGRLYTELWSMFSPVRAHIDPSKWCFVSVAALEASKHDPNPDHCSKILTEIVKFERNAIY